MPQSTISFPHRVKPSSRAPHGSLARLFFDLKGMCRREPRLIDVLAEAMAVEPSERAVWPAYGKAKRRLVDECIVGRTARDPQLWLPAQYETVVRELGWALISKVEKGICEPLSGERESIPVDLRWHVWERDNFTCRRCRSRTRLSIDHIVPVSKGGPTTPQNLQTLCSSCNSSKGAR